MRHELSIDKVRTDITIPISSVGTTKIKPETLLYNLNKIINENNISNVDYTTGGIQNNKLEPLSNIFSDNIIVYYFLDKIAVENSKVLQQFLLKSKNKSKNKEENKEEEVEDAEEEEDKGNRDNRENSLQELLNDCKPYLAEHTLKTKRIFNSMGLKIDKTDIKPTIPKVINGQIAQLLKVSLANCSYEDVIRVIENPNLIDCLNKEGIFIHDIDFTRDYKGIFNKRELIQHLILELGFRMQNERKEEEGEDEEEPTTTILDNDDYVGRNCLTFITSTANGRIRYKFYNKFVQCVESPSVRTAVGNHFYHWTNNPEMELKKAINNCLDTGILRLEITFYRLGTSQTLPQDFIEKHMEYLSECIPPNLLYYNPISTQWNLLLEHVSYNLCLVDIEKKLAFVCLYLNKETGKTNGFYVRDCSNNMLSNILKLYTINVPLVVLLLNIDRSSSSSSSTNFIEIQKDVYVKDIATDRQYRHNYPELITFTTNGSKYFYRCTAKEQDKQPQEMGLIDSDKCKLRIQTHKMDIVKQNTANINIVFIPTNVNVRLDFPDSATTFRQANRELQNRIKETKFQEANSTKIAEIVEKNKAVERELEEQLYRLHIKQNMDNTFYTTTGNIRKIIDIPDNTILYVFGVKETTTKFGPQKVLICSEEEEQTDKTILEAYWSVAIINKYVDTYKTKWKKLLEESDGNEDVWYGTYKGISIFKFRKLGFRYNQQRNKYALVEVLSGRGNRSEDTTTTDIFKLPRILATGYSSKGSVKIEELIRNNIIQTGDTITIKTVSNRYTAKLLLQIEHKNNTRSIIANYWLKDLYKKEIEKHKTSFSCDIPQFSCIVGTEKYTPHKKLEHTFYRELPLPIGETSK
jgi:hypothetical protein